VYDTAVNEVALWHKAAAAQLDAQLRERRRHFSRRLEAVSRIQQAAGGLDERIRELQSRQAALYDLEAQLAAMTEQLLAEPEAAAEASAKRDLAL
jgi:2,4-dienoyl-CoA reductase-like NADH-dependent reductase (Old Yellow Enzyme family)